MVRNVSSSIFSMLLVITKWASCTPSLSINLLLFACWLALFEVIVLWDITSLYESHIDSFFYRISGIWTNMICFTIHFLGCARYRSWTFWGFFPPSLAYPPSSPCIVSYLLFLSIFPSASLGMFPIQNWQEEKLPFVSPFPPHLC